MSRVCLNQSGATDTIAVVCAAVSRGCSVGSRARDLFTASSAGSNGRFRPLTNITHTKPGRAVCVTACECVCTHLHTYRTAAYHVCALCWSLRVFPLQEATDVRILPSSRRGPQSAASCQCCTGRSRQATPGCQKHERASHVRTRRRIDRSRPAGTCRSMQKDAEA